MSIVKHYSVRGHKFEKFSKKETSSECGDVQFGSEKTTSSSSLKMLLMAPLLALASTQSNQSLRFQNELDEKPHLHNLDQAVDERDYITDMEHFFGLIENMDFGFSGEEDIEANMDQIFLGISPSSILSSSGERSKSFVSSDHRRFDTNSSFFDVSTQSEFDLEAIIGRAMESLQKLCIVHRDLRGYGHQNILMENYFPPRSTMRNGSMRNDDLQLNQTQSTGTHPTPLREDEMLNKAKKKYEMENRNSVYDSYKVAILI